nr:GGDEF domain-containing protein [Anaerotignum propionicum]
MENTDELTGLPNSKLFYRQYYSFMRRHHERRKTIFMFDIDNFKHINDTQGHLYGNEILAKVGNILKKTVEGHGIAARWGGDEFVGALDASPQEAEGILKGFMEDLRKLEKEMGYIVTVSVGITEIHKPFNEEQLIQKVDEAVYISKQNGRNQITLYK